MYTKEQIEKIKQARIYLASLGVTAADVEILETAESLLHDARKTSKKDRGGQSVKEFALSTLSCLFDDGEISEDFAQAVDEAINQLAQENIVKIKYPDIQVQLTNEDGNAFAIIGRVQKALKQGGVDKVDIDLFRKEAMAGNYDHVLVTCMKWVDIS